MAVKNLSEMSIEQQGFYAPAFEIKIEGAGLPGDVLRDVLQITYKDSLKEIDSFELTVNNWDPTNNRFKYIGSETAKSQEGGTSWLFEPGKKEVALSMGYAGKLVLMLTGVFTTLEPNFPSGGGPTLNVRGLNVLHQLRKKQYTTVWSDGKKDSEIAKNIGTLLDDTTGTKRFPLPIRIDTNALQKEPELTYVAQENRYDIDFLLSRARERGYVVFIEEKSGSDKKGRKQLYFGPSESPQNPGFQDVTYELEWGKSLVDFKPTLTTANQIKSVTVKGWNRKTRKAIKEKVTIDDPKLKINKDLRDLLKKNDAREEFVVDEPVFTEKQARERAMAILLDRHKEMVKASGTTIGLPYLRAGRPVQIKGLGVHFNGTYFVTETTHTISSSGYTTRFNARRENKS
jgi:phage protein D